jgi:type VI secretion system protein ImpK
VLERGRDLLEDLRNDVSRTVRRYSDSEAEEPLSKDAKAAKGGKRINSVIPLWMVGVCAIALLVIVQVYAQFSLSSALTPVVSKIQGLTAG